MRKRVKSLIIGFTLLLSACGMPGDLYLPDKSNNDTTEQTTQGLNF